MPSREEKRAARKAALAKKRLRAKKKNGKIVVEGKKRKLSIGINPKGALSAVRKKREAQRRALNYSR